MCTPMLTYIACFIRKNNFLDFKFMKDLMIKKKKVI